MSFQEGDRENPHALSAAATARRRCGAWLLLATTAMAACSPLFGTLHTPTPAVPSPTAVPPTSTPPPLAAIVNGEFITLADYEIELAQFHAAQAAIGIATDDADARIAVLDDMIAQLLLAQAARHAGLEASPADLKKREDALAADLGESYDGWKSEHGYSDESFRSALERAVDAALMRDRIIADVPLQAPQVHVRQILAYNAGDARAVFERLQAGEDFDEIAALSDPITHGELGWIPQGYLLDAAANDAVFALEAGESSEVIETPAGFHIFKVIERATRPLAPDALLRAQESALQKWLQDERLRSEVQIVVE